MPKIHGDDPAMPLIQNSTVVCAQRYRGMTKREEIASRNLQGLLSNISELRQRGWLEDEVVEYAISKADKLLELLNNDPTEFQEAVPVFVTKEMNNALQK